MLDMDTARLRTALPRVRCSFALRERLDRVVARSGNPDVADHIRVAVERYVEAENERQQLQVQPEGLAR